MGVDSAVKLNLYLLIICTVALKLAISFSILASSFRISIDHKLFIFTLPSKYPTRICLKTFVSGSMQVKK